MLTLLLQGLPPLPTGGGPTIDIMNFVINALFAIVWTVVAVVAFAIVIPVAMFIFNKMTRNIDEMEELKKGNVAVAIVLFGFIVSITLIVVTILIK
ncbi:MAG: DUF350 domain-containing protein [Chloroflexi bacterium]|nr:DUF350 domain-containing protein [Chloroflexota bacterium]